MTNIRAVLFIFQEFQGKLNTNMLLMYLEYCVTIRVVF